METKPLINRTIFRIYQLVPIQFNSFPHNLFANLKKLYSFIGIYVHFIWLMLRFEYGGQINHSVFWLAPVLQKYVSFNTGGKETQTRLCGTVYLGVDELSVCEGFLCIGMC